MQWGYESRPGAKGYNQDAVWSSADGAFAVVADGAGGGRRGSEKASAAVVETSRALYRGAADDLMHIFVEVNRTLLRRLAQGEDVGLTTFAAVQRVTAADVVACVYGDSPIYHVRGGRVLRRVRPRYRFDIIIEHGFVSQEDADRVYDALPWWLKLQLGIWLPVPAAHPTPHTTLLTVAPGDVLILCTDGVAEHLSPEELAATACSLPPKEAAHHLIEVASRRGAADDVTCAVGRVGHEPGAGAIFRPSP